MNVNFSRDRLATILVTILIGILILLATGVLFWFFMMGGMMNNGMMNGGMMDQMANGCVEMMKNASQTK